MWKVVLIWWGSMLINHNEGKEMDEKYLLQNKVGHYHPNNESNVDTTEK